MEDSVLYVCTKESGYLKKEKTLIEAGHSSILAWMWLTGCFEPGWHVTYTEPSQVKSNPKGLYAGKCGREKKRGHRVHRRMQ